MDIREKYLTCVLCDALLRNVNDNFESVSFEILRSGNIQTKIVLSKLTEQEDEYIDDLMAEFDARLGNNSVLKELVEVGDSPPLSNLVYRRA